MPQLEIRKSVAALKNMLRYKSHWFEGKYKVGIPQILAFEDY